MKMYKSFSSIEKPGKRMFCRVLVPKGYIILPNPETAGKSCAAGGKSRNGAICSGARNIV
ncbi:hypothetical protein CN563_19565 [Bacillus sp. AFS026049]|nr:hypothetical protein CON84_14455 [Bacillus sp. AFS094228]PEO44573.1 hypothetical protein CN563_19565 [Bacillus sp. AFS026049]